MVIVAIAAIAGGVYAAHKNLPVSTTETNNKKAGAGVPMMMQPQTPPATTTTQTAQLATGAAAHAPTSLTFDVSGGSFYFVPSIIHVKKGDKVTIVFTDNGGFHNFMIDEFNIKIGPLSAAGQTASTTFVADKTGTFTFYCGVGNHRQMGQVGTIVVE